MFELLVKITDLHSAMEPAQTMGLNLTGEKNEVYDSMPTGGAPWAEHGYDMRATDAAGLAAEGGANGPFACDNDGFKCFIFNRQAFDNGVVGDTDSIYTNFGTGAEIAHTRVPPDGKLGGGGGEGGGASARAKPLCSLGEDCNGLG